MSDSYQVYTGFANVARHVSTYLKNTDKYEIAYVGWFHQPLNKIEAPFTYYTTIKNHTDKCCRRGEAVMKHEPGKKPVYFKSNQGILVPMQDGPPCLGGDIIEPDKYAFQTLHGIILEWKPDIVWTLGDSLAEDRMIPYKVGEQLYLKSFKDFWDWAANADEDRPVQDQIGEDGVPRQFIDLSDLGITTLTHKGWKPITHISRHYYAGNLARVIQPKGSTVCTFNHSLMYQYGEEFKEAKPQEFLEKELANIEVFDKYKFNKEETQDVDDWEKARIYGAYVSEGSASDTSCGKRIRISSTNIEWLYRLQDDFETVYKKRGSIETCVREGYKDCYNLVIWGKDIFKEFTREAGRGCEEKKVPNFIFNASKQCIQEFLRLAYEGDGYNGTEVSYTTKSLELASGISFLLKMLGQKHSIRWRDEKEAYTIRNIWKNRNPETAVYRVDSIPYEGNVYDLTVDDAHTFVDALGCVLAHNTWMVYHTQFMDVRKCYRWIEYVPIDGTPMPGITEMGNQVINWVDTIENADTPVSFCDFGRDAMIATAKVYGKDLSKVKVIYHGNDNENYKPLPNRIELKKKLFNLDEKTFLIGCFSRNQPRKAFHKLFEALALGKKKGYWDGKMVKCYMHCPIKDVGWNLPGLIKWHGIEDIVLLNDKLHVAQGPTDAQMNELYNACDLMTMPSRGEGWGLTYSEAMAAGVPVLMSAYSAHHDWAKGGAARINVRCVDSEPITNIDRAIVDVEDYCEKIRAFQCNINIEDYVTKFGPIEDYKGTKYEVKQ